MNDTEKKAEIQTRIDEFMKRHEANAKELQIDFAIFPVYSQIAPNVYATIPGFKAVDTKYVNENPETSDNVLKA